MRKSNTAWAFITIGLGAVLACILPWVLTSRSWFGISFHDTGPVGDTIGGITGPVLNFAGLLVIYFSLREQLAANDLQRVALDDQKRQIETEQRDSQNEKYFELTYKLLEKLSDAAQKSEPNFIDMVKLDYYHQHGNQLIYTDQEDDEANKMWLWYYRQIQDMLNLYSLIMSRMETDILSLDQKQLLVSLLELQYISKLDRCRIEYQDLFKNIDEKRQEQLIVLDDQRDRLYNYNEALKGKVADANIPVL